MKNSRIPKEKSNNPDSLSYIVKKKKREGGPYHKDEEIHLFDLTLKSKYITYQDYSDNTYDLLRSTS